MSPPRVRMAQRTLRPRWLTRRRLRRIAAAGAAAVTCLLLTLVVLWHVFPFPLHRLEKMPQSITVTDAGGNVMLRLVGRDDQWRTPIPLDRMSSPLVQATLAAEDERFWSHPGIDPIAVVRAMGQNLAAGGVRSGASTITMQVARMVEPRHRTVWAKAVQAFRALQLEAALPKNEIIEDYLNMAPYGGNIRGVEEAAQRYFGRSAADLSIAEAALLAGLPKSPERLRPDRDPAAAKLRRDWVLGRMVECGAITAAQCEAARATPVTLAAHHAPGDETHAAWLALAHRPDGGRTTIDPGLQTRISSLAAQHLRTLPDRTQIAAVVIEIKTGHLVAMAGAADHALADAQVNGALAYRSPGSALKPFIYAAAMQASRLAAASIVPDAPIDRAGWSPENFDRVFLGDLTAAESLRRSLNIPAMRITEAIGPATCIRTLERSGIRFRDGAAQRAGLALATGGAEVRLLDLANAYATLGRDGLYRAVALFPDDPAHERRVLESAVCQTISSILSCRERTPRGQEHRDPRTLPWFCWKTGTSSSRRDAVAAGHNRRFAAAVWVGDFGGRGRIAYLGAEAAEPLLAQILTMPGLAADADPQPTPPIQVSKPLVFRDSDEALPRIVTPRPDAVYIAGHDGTAAIQLKAAGPIDGTWFVDNLICEADDVLRLPRGTHEVRRVTPNGRSAVSRFEVR